MSLANSDERFCISEAVDTLLNGDQTLSEREEFLVQSQERSSGVVVYNGMNNKGDFFIGNQKLFRICGEKKSKLKSRQTWST